MANQINIDIGAAANDGTGDPLRTAFNYVNLNFANVWATGLPNSNVQFNNNRILTVNTNANLVLAPNGTGVVQSNVSIVPNTDRVHNLGSSAKKWDSIYANYLNLSNLDINADLTVGGNLIVEGDTIQIGNIVTDTKTIQLANTAGTGNLANGSGITVGANDNIATLLYNSNSNVWATNIGISAVGNITAPYFFGNGSQLTGITTYANANAVAYGQSGWAGNIIPAGNNVYNLGNITNQWNDLYLSNATIFMNGVPIGLTFGNILTVNGNDVVTTNANGTVDLANLAIDNNNIFNTQGQGVVISNFSFIDEAETAYVQIPAGNSASDLSIVQTQGNVRLAANTVDWTFDTSGNLTLPVNGSIVLDGGDGVIGPVSDDMVISWDNEEIRLVSVQGSIEMQADAAFRVQTNYDGGSDTYLSRWEFNQDEIVNITGPSAIITEAGDLNLQSGRDTLSSGNVSVTAINNGVAINTWTFGLDGNLTLPSEGNIVGVTPNNAGRIQWVGNSSGDGAGYTTLGLIPDDTLVNNDQYLIIDPTAPGHIHIRAGGEQDNSSADLFLGGENSYFKVTAGANNEVRISANSHGWVFGADSVLTVPGEGLIRSIGDVVTLQSYNVGTGNVQSVYLGSGGGLGFFDQDIGGNWLEIFKSGAEPQIRVPVGRGNLNIQTAEGINAYDWVFDNTGNFTAPGNITGNTAGFAIGYRDIPQVTLSGNATAALADAGKHFYSTTAGNLSITLPDNSSVAFPTGATLTIVVNAAGNVLVDQGPGVTLYQAGASATGNRVVGAYGLASVMKVAANTWVISGTGVY
jgi:hypothetical protein